MQVLALRIHLLHLHSLYMTQRDPAESPFKRSSFRMLPRLFSASCFGDQARFPFAIVFHLFPLFSVPFRFSF